MKAQSPSSNLQSRRNFIKHGAFFLPTIFIPRMIPAQTALTAPGLAGFVPPPASGGGGGGAFTLIATGSGTSSANVDCTVSTMDTTGAKLIAVCVEYGGGSVPTMTDNKGNGTPSTAQTGNLSGGNPKSSWLYYANPTVGAGHVITIPGVSGTTLSVHAYAFSYTGTTPTLHLNTFGEVNTGNWASGAGVKPGSITPANANSLFLSSAIHNVASTGIANNSSFTMPLTAISPGLQSGYKIKSSDSTAEDPNWTASSGNSDAFATLIDFN